MTRSLVGHSFGEYKIESDLFTQEDVSNKTKQFSLSLREIAQSVPIGTREISVELNMDSTAAPDEEQVNEIRFLIPNDEDLSALKESFTKYSTKSIVTTLNEVSLLLPRGHHDLEFSLAAVKFRGKTNTFNVKYTNVARLFLLPRGDISQDILIVLQLDSAVRLGNTSYPFLVLNIDKNSTVTDICIESTPEVPDLPITSKDEEKLQLDLVLSLFTAFNRKLAPTMAVETYPHAIRCSHRAFDGAVYVVKRGLIFVVKPVVFVAWADVQAVELMRASAAMGGRFFDLRVFVKGGAVLDFQQIDRGVYGSLVAELQNLGVKIRNLATAETGGPGAAETAQAAGMDLDDSEEDESYKDSEDEDVSGSDSGSPSSGNSSSDSS